MANYPQPIAEYKAHKNQVNLVNDIYCGRDTAKKHLRKFEREENNDFANRQLDCTIDNYVFRTVQTRKNIIFRKPINLSNITSETLKEWCEKDFDLKGNSINDFGKDWLVNADRDGFAFALVDTPQRTEDIVTALDEQENNIRPYALLIKREDLFYWEMDSYGNYKVIAFYESYEVENGGLFGFETKQQVKAFFNDGSVRIYREDKEVANYYRDVKEITIYKLGKSDIPMFYDMSAINIKQMNRESEKSNYVRVASAPFPLIFGDLKGGEENEGQVQTMSVQQGLHFESKEECDFKWAEMSGNNYEILKEELKELSAQMENISINFATESNVKTATQVEMDATEDESRLTDRAQMLEDGLNALIQFMGLLKSDLNTEEQTVEVNKDFSTNKLTPEQQQSLLMLFTQGVISRDRLTRALERGEVLELLNDEERAKEETELINENVGGEGLEV